MITLKRLHAKRDTTCAEEAANEEKTCREKYDEQLEEVRDERDAGMDSPVWFLIGFGPDFIKFDWILCNILTKI